jgi:hypothetical protein
MSLLTNLISYYKLSDTSDSVGSNTLTNTGSVDFTQTGKLGGTTKCATGTNTTGGYLKVASDLGYNSASSNTWNFWYKSAASMSSGYIMDVISGTNTIRGIVYEDGSTKKLHGFANGNEVLSGVLTQNMWYMVTLTKSGTAWEFFINGISQGTTTTGGGSYTATAGFMLLNGLQTGGIQTTSSVDECGIWSRVLSSTEVTQLYNGGAGLQYPFSGGGASFLFNFL